MRFPGDCRPSPAAWIRKPLAHHYFFTQTGVLFRTRPTPQPHAVSLISRISARPGTLVAALTALALTGCSKQAWLLPRQSTMDPAGPIAQVQYETFMGTVWLSLVLFVIVGGAFVWAVFRYREKPEHAGKPVPKQGHGNPLIEIGIIMLSIGALVFIAVPTIEAIWKMYDEKPEFGYTLNGETAERKASAKASALKAWYPYEKNKDGVENYAVKSDEDVLEINVVGKQWWFRFEYPQFGLEHGTDKRSVSNEFVIPVGKVVKINLRSDDVIHSFWLPKVAGKVDLVPGRRNGMWIQADKPGHYYGQCAEFCGDAHAYMLFRCDAVSEADFKLWIEKQKSNAKPATGDLAKQGEKLFAQKTCVMCHTIGGLAGAGGDFGPDLTHLASRKTLAGSWMFNYDDKALSAQELAANSSLVTPVVDKAILKDNLVRWIGSSGINTEVTKSVASAGMFGSNTKGDVKPGNRMHYYKGMFKVTGLREGLQSDPHGDKLTKTELEALAEYLSGLE